MVEKIDREICINCDMYKVCQIYDWFWLNEMNSIDNVEYESKNCADIRKGMLKGVQDIIDGK